MSQLVAIMVDAATGEIVAPAGVRFPLGLLGTAEVPLIVEGMINPALVAIELPDNMVLKDADGKVSLGDLNARVVVRAAGVNGRILLTDLDGRVAVKDELTGKLPAADIPDKPAVAMPYYADEPAAHAALEGLTGDVIAFFDDGGQVCARRRVGGVYSTTVFLQ